MEVASPRMEDDNLSQSSPPTETDLSCVRNGHEPRETDIFLAVFGVTGFGKSSFISHLTTDKCKPEVGHSLDSCEFKQFWALIIILPLFQGRLKKFSYHRSRYAKCESLPIRLLRQS